MLTIAFFLLLEAVSLQVIQVNETAPCFLNYSAGAEMWENCGFGDDFLVFSLAPWEWITGGFFSMIFVSLMILFTYIKYHNALYPAIIGLMFIPISATFFPDVFIYWAAGMLIFVIAIGIWYGFIKQTKEY